MVEASLGESNKSGSIELNFKGRKENPA